MDVEIFCRYLATVKAMCVHVVIVAAAVVVAEVAVSCDETCDVSAVLSPMFRVSRVQPRVLTVDILQVSPRNAGRYRCQAVQDATQLAVEGKCTCFLL